MVALTQVQITVENDAVSGDGTIAWRPDGFSGTHYPPFEEGGAATLLALRFDLSQVAVLTNPTFNTLTITLPHDQVTEAHSGTPNLTIDVEDVANSAALSTPSREPADLTLTGTPISWNSVANPGAGNYTSPNLAALLNDLISSYGAANIGFVTFVFGGATGQTVDYLVVHENVNAWSALLDGDYDEGSSVLPTQYRKLNTLTRL